MIIVQAMPNCDERNVGATGSEHRVARKKGESKVTRKSVLRIRKYNSGVKRDVAYLTGTILSKLSEISMRKPVRFAALTVSCCCCGVLIISIAFWANLAVKILRSD